MPVSLVAEHREGHLTPSQKDVSAPRMRPSSAPTHGPVLFSFPVGQDCSAELGAILDASRWRKDSVASEAGDEH